MIASTDVTEAQHKGTSSQNKSMVKSNRKGEFYMKFRKIGNLEVSAVGMGCMGFSHGYGEVPTEEYSIRAIQKAYEAGCTFFDTAEVYGDVGFYPGHNEQIVGKAVKSFREKVVIATKFHLKSDDFAEGVNLYDAISRHIKKSLENLQTDYIDLYYLHRVHEAVPVEAVAEVMGRFIDEGVIRAWGLSQVGVDQIAKAHEVTPVTAVQNIYSMLERDCEMEVFPYCMEHNIGVVP